MAFDYTTAQPIQSNNAAPVANPTTNVAPSATPAATQAFDPSTAQPIELNAQGFPTLQTGLSNTMEQVYAGANAALTGVAAGVGSMANLATNIMKGTYKAVGMDKAADSIDYLQNWAGPKYNQAVDSFLHDPKSDIIMGKHPGIYAAIAGPANVAAQIVSGQPLTSAGNAIVNPILNKVLPTALNGPIAQNAISQAVQGGALGAANNPEQPMTGALYGALSGAVFGAGSGYVGSKATKAGTIIEKEYQNAQEAGLDPNSLGVINKIKSELNTKGIQQTKRTIQDQLEQNNIDEINKIRPQGAINESPAQTIINRASINYKEVAPINKANWKPLQEAPGIAEPQNTTAAITEVEKDLPSLGLPKKPLPSDATLNDLINYERKVSNIQNTAYKQVRLGVGTTYDEAKLYDGILSGIQSDMQVLAKSQGLDGQLAEAKDYYAQNLAPFKVFNRAGIVQDPAKAANAFKLINQQFKSRNPDIEKIGTIAQALGPQGQRLVGYGYIENMYRRSFNAEGEFDPGKFSLYAKKLTAFGTESKIMLPEHQQVLQGLQKINEAGVQILKQSAPVIPQGMLGFVQQKIQQLVHSESGIMMLRTLGGSGPKSKAFRTISQQLLGGIIEMGYSKYKTDQQQNENDQADEQP